MDLRGQRILVTGAASRLGIGRSVCRMALERNAIVFAADRDRAGLTDISDSMPEIGGVFLCDVTSGDDCNLIAKYFTENEGLDALIHCAGVVEPVGLSGLTRERYDWMLDVNLWGTIQIAQAVVPSMIAKGRGSITCISSVAGQRGGGMVGGLHYAASKAGVLGFVKGLARELGSHGVRVNAVAPGLVDTDMTSPFMSAEERSGLAKHTVLGRLATPEEVAGVCLFLSSDLASYITGSTVDVNGGLHIH